MDAALLKVVPAVKSTAEFVTIPDVTWDDVGGLHETKKKLHNQFMVSSSYSFYSLIHFFIHLQCKIELKYIRRYNGLSKIVGKVKQKLIRVLFQCRAINES